ncbi:MAG TPA: AMP-binding protein [Bacteroidales bacterium]|jgi:long-chain acyl-CoA synthetase|nr:AMP-binding protein [Bacteroidales bacterium]
MPQQTRFTFPSAFNETLKKYPGKNAYSFAGEKPLTWQQVNSRILSVMSFLERNGIKPGDRVAILSQNMPEWPLAFFAVTFMGAVAVPVLPEFSSTEVTNVLEHSGTKAVFVSASLLNRVAPSNHNSLKLVITIEDFGISWSAEHAAELVYPSVPAGNYTVEEDDLASIIYTSGTTGRSKGVMLTHKNITFNALMGGRIQPIDENDRFLSVLPLSHTYENTLGLILPLLYGSCVYYLRKPPTPAILLPALEQVKPTMMLTVPLIIEKVYFNKILPKFRDSKLLSSLYKFSAMRRFLNVTAGKKLMKTFGGQLKFFGIGGAKLNPAVEKFLIEARFPYAVGYGLTESSPLLAGSNPQNTILEGIGPAIQEIELKINDPDPETGEGEIWARGPNIMKGYYLEPEMTSETITPDGWLKTGDLGVFDEKGNLFIKGRLKNMILSSTGENIYPEEIESIINNFRYVVESLVIEQKGKLVALVHLNMEELEKKYHSFRDDMGQKKEEFLNEIRNYVNSQVNKFSRIQKVMIQREPFQKTATLKIKRFLYK